LDSYALISVLISFRFFYFLCILLPYFVAVALMCNSIVALSQLLLSGIDYHFCSVEIRCWVL